MNTTPPIPPATMPTSVPVLIALDALGVEVCMVASSEEVGVVVVTTVTLGESVLVTDSEFEEEEDEVVMGVLED